MRRRLAPWCLRIRGFFGRGVRSRSCHDHFREFPGLLGGRFRHETFFRRLARCPALSFRSANARIVHRDFGQFAGCGLVVVIGLDGRGLAGRPWRFLPHCSGCRLGRRRWADRIRPIEQVDDDPGFAGGIPATSAEQRLRDHDGDHEACREPRMHPPARGMGRHGLACAGADARVRRFRRRIGRILEQSFPRLAREGCLDVFLLHVLNPARRCRAPVSTA